MSETLVRSQPPDQREREQALDPARSILVQAPAGSGKTDLLTRRFLRLLGEVDAPGRIVAITFTNAAAAEMRHRILAELEQAAANDSARASSIDADEFSMASLASRALERSHALGWNLLDLPAQLRISTIDSFCRELALQQPLLSGLGGGIGIAEQPRDLYRRAARRTLEMIDGSGDAPSVALTAAIESLLLWRDNNWQDLEDLLVAMLGVRDRWMHDFVLAREPDWNALRVALERPFANAVRNAIDAVGRLLDEVPHARREALELARFARDQTNRALHRDLAEQAEFPREPFPDNAMLEEARQAYACLADLLLTEEGAFRRQVDKRIGFPADFKQEKSQLLALIDDLKQISGLEAALVNVCKLPPAHYSEDDWQIVRACFTLLRHAAGELQVVFAEAGTVDFTEVAQIALRVLQDESGQPSDAAIAVADGIRHLLVDEFQDTSRRQHELLRRLVAAWPEREGRTCFVVGDPMQSIYFFRDADAELFNRLRILGLEIPGADLLTFDFVPLRANFRTTPPLVAQLNSAFERIFAASNGSGIAFFPAEAARDHSPVTTPHFALHLEFMPQPPRDASAKENAAGQIEAAREAQTVEIVDLVRAQLPLIEEKRARGEKHRIAVLGRARSALAPIAAALREASIPFRAVDLEQLADRPEVVDALSLARALLNPEDRVAWLGALRAPWCGLALDDLHKLTSDDDAELLARPVPDLLAERLPLLSKAGQSAARRVLDAVNSAPRLCGALPNAPLGTHLEQAWLRLGGADCVDATARANLDLLWSCLDNLPRGEQDLLGPALGVALEKLTALPDPGASSDCGVQLMTIHKSKGLEFEIVIVPDLQARCGSGNRDLLSWLERGVRPEDGAEQSTDSGEITEFLVAPIQPRGANRGEAKAWVDRVRREREAQEDRRILYVAATRAREHLHLFARPAYKSSIDGALTLCEPANSLLATAWPALEEEVRARFEQWRAEPFEIESIAAGTEDSLLVLPPPVPSTLLRRLPSDYNLGPDNWHFAAQSQPVPAVEFSPSRLYERHEGGPLSRALGRAVHMLLEELARLRATKGWDSARTALQRFEPRITADLRAIGVDQPQAHRIAADALQIALNASRDPAGQWILSPHAEAASEVRWAGVVDGALRTVQVDRVFRAGAAPQSAGDDCWWIVDYKTAHEDAPDPIAALPKMRDIFAPQLEAYAAVLRNLHGNDAPIYAGLYYPRMSLFDWWEA
jgi:ATP-dependent helicase/nuclease subunit A